MSDYDNTDSGVLFANKDKTTDSHPNAKGSLNVGGVEYWVSAWTNTSKAGEKYQKLKIKRKDEAAPKPAPAAPAEFVDDTDIPF